MPGGRCGRLIVYPSSIWRAQASYISDFNLEGSGSVRTIGARREQGGGVQSVSCATGVQCVQ